MTERFMFFDSANTAEPDRTYNAQEFTDYFEALVTTGIMKGLGDMLKVDTSGSNMTTTIDTGIAFLAGRFYENDSLMMHSHDTESLGRSRIDRIVVRMDLSADARHVKSFIKKGAPSITPLAPTLQRDANIHEISLAQITIIGGQTFINKVDVIDERGKDDICPWASSNILPNFDDATLAELVYTVQNDVIKKTEKGRTNGVASLDAAGKVPSNQLNVTQPPDATTAVKGVVQLNNSVTSAITTQAATAFAVKTAYDRGDSAFSNVNIANNTINMLMAKLMYSHISIGNMANGSGQNAISIGPASSATAKNAISLGYSIDNPNANRATLGATTGGGLWDSTDYWVVPGSFSVQGSKQFEIPHPHPDKKQTHMLRHSSVESPTAGETLYRYAIEALTDGETVTVQLPDYFQYLNKDVDVWINADKHFAHAYGEVIGDTLIVSCEKAGKYKALVIGTRNDDSIQIWGIRGAEREVGEGWEGQTYSFEVDEFNEYVELEEAE